MLRTLTSTQPESAIGESELLERHAIARTERVEVAPKGRDAVDPKERDSVAPKDCVRSELLPYSIITTALIALAIFAALTLFDFMAGNRITATMAENVIVGIIWAIIIRPIIKKLGQTV